MFGYVTVYKPELKIKDFEKYKGYYCGLCRSLKSEYGISGQLTLTYDMTFAIILLTSLYESETKCSNHRCVVHPIYKKMMLQNEISEYAAAMNVILAYYHLEDDWKDEKSVKGYMGSALLRKKVRGIEEQYPRQCSIIKGKLQQLQEYEKNNIEDIDIVAGCFGEIMSELFVYQEDCWEQTLRQIGFYLGKFIYIMDAYDDIEKDRKNQSYNPLCTLYEEHLKCGTIDVFRSRCFEILQMMMAETSAEFEKLPCLLDIDILRNILYDGVWVKYNTKRETQGNKEKR